MLKNWDELAGCCAAVWPAWRWFYFGFALSYFSWLQAATFDVKFQAFRVCCGVWIFQKGGKPEARQVATDMTLIWSLRVLRLCNLLVYATPSQSVRRLQAALAAIASSLQWRAVLVRAAVARCLSSNQTHTGRRKNITRDKKWTIAIAQCGNVRETWARWILATCTTSPLWTAFCPIGRNGANAMCRLEPYLGADSTCFHLQFNSLPVRGWGVVLGNRSKDVKWSSAPQTDQRKQKRLRRKTSWLPDCLYFSSLALWKSSPRRYPSKGGYGCTSALWEPRVTSLDKWHRKCDENISCIKFSTSQHFLWQLNWGRLHVHAICRQDSMWAMFPPVHPYGRSDMVVRRSFGSVEA